MWRLSLRYFSTRVVREAPLEAGKQYIFGYHPHGILVMSRIFFYGGAWEALFPGVKCRVLGATPMFKVPACRELCLAMSAVDAGRKTAERCLAAGLSLMVYPGGSSEIFLTDPNSTVTDLVLLKRKGFVRLALRSGAALVPVFVFGEKHCYRRLNPPKALRDAFLRYLRARAHAAQPKATQAARAAQREGAARGRARASQRVAVAAHAAAAACSCPFCCSGGAGSRSCRCKCL